ncbi:Peptide transporter family 1 [Eumeta japonica]|uniref:Peptide transporter family 1 n=1 Tax=Eumeta variegata TaxID=151549 RepID=A0A4C1U0H6_EUMVA|nr:Peptide transporter family 1 [Eumeta japonica]
MLAAYDFTTEFVRSSENCPADAPSRLLLCSKGGRAERLFSAGLQNYNNSVFPLQDSALKEIHNGNPDIIKIKQNNVLWGTLDGDIERVVRECAACRYIHGRGPQNRDSESNGAVQNAVRSVIRALKKARLKSEDEEITLNRSLFTYRNTEHSTTARQPSFAPHAASASAGAEAVSAPLLTTPGHEKRIALSEQNNDNGNEVARKEQAGEEVQSYTSPVKSPHEEGAAPSSPVAEVLPWGPAVLRDVKDSNVIVVTNANSITMSWLLPQFFIISLGEVLFAVTGNEFAFKEAPVSMKAVMTAVWLLTEAAGNVLIIVITRLEAPASMKAAMTAVWLLTEAAGNVLIIVITRLFVNYDQVSH